VSLAGISVAATSFTSALGAVAVVLSESDFTMVLYGIQHSVLVVGVWVLSSRVVSHPGVVYAAVTQSFLGATVVGRERAGIRVQQRQGESRPGIRLTRLAQKPASQPIIARGGVRTSQGAGQGGEGGGGGEGEG
jgi:hypothetical protein